MQWIEVDPDAWYPVARYAARIGEFEFKISLYKRPEICGNYHLQQFHVVDDQRFWLGSGWCSTLAETVQLAEQWLLNPGESGFGVVNSPEFTPDPT
jgi:hypothetical protein